MKVETDWKLMFVLEFDTLLFELKLLRPAFVLLLALLPTISVFYLSIKRTNTRNRTLNNERQIPPYFSLDVFRIRREVRQREESHCHLKYLIDYLINLIALYCCLILLPNNINPKRKTRKRKPTGSRRPQKNTTRRDAKRNDRDPHPYR